MSVEWLCKRCSVRLGKSIEPEPCVLRRCTGCDVENYCYPSGHVGEDVESIPREEIEEAKEVIREGERIMKVLDVAQEEIDAARIEENKKEMDEIIEKAETPIGVIIEAETVADEQDNAVAEEAAPSAAEPSLPEEASVEEENTTMSKEEQIRAQIAELEAKLEADKE